MYPDTRTPKILNGFQFICPGRQTWRVMPDRDEKILAVPGLRENPNYWGATNRNVIHEVLAETNCTLA
jgi:hypothetical protein